MTDVEKGKLLVCTADPHSTGVFALFDPEQQALLHKDIVEPEGRIHFTSEHASC